MRNYVSLIVSLLFIPVLASAASPSAGYEKNWPQGRGADATVVSPYTKPPVKWDESNNSNEKLDGISGLYASPSGADGKVCIAGRNGMPLVMEHGSRFEILPASKLYGGFSASSVIVGDELYLRGEKFLYCIAAK